MAHRATYFAYTSYAFDPEKKEILFNYEIGFADRGPMLFTESVTLPDLEMQAIPQPLLAQLLEDVHTMLGISYYKLYCPPEIRTNRVLTKERADFWDAVYRKGLGEFAYRNDLDLKESIHFPFTDVVASRPLELPTRDRALVGVGGGKDSVVTIELLKEKIPCNGFVVETYTEHTIADAVSAIAGISNLKIKRTLDKQVFDRLPGSYSGHIPISAVYAFLGFFAAALYGYRYVVMSNEHSSNFGNVEHHGETVNHQWSKSVEFEQLFDAYTKKYLTDSITYFSLMRPFYEIRIAELFAKYPKYFSQFSSCNRKFIADRSKQPRGMWCCECPKCAFVFLVLAPFIERTELIGIFGRDLLSDRGLLPLYQDILGFGTMKPFDCVGTFDEAQAALYLVRESYADAAVVQKLLPRIEQGDQKVKDVLRVAQALTVPTRFRFLGMKDGLILGYGKEGRSTETYLKKTYPNLILGTADESEDAQYLEKQNEYDIVAKTPGIPKEKVQAQYVTATNVFFSECKNPIIGVTGSKGKSTTASLVHKILSGNGIPAKLAGNIGSPMLELLAEQLDGKTVIVLELSSYQLDDIEFSPHIVIATNLFPDHMDYHGDVEAYYRAKKNIVRFQKSTDLFVYNPRVDQLKDWANGVRSKPTPFVELPFDVSVVPLLGEHNIDNVRAAITVARLYGIPDADVERSVHTFKGLPHRLEFVGEYKDIRFYDDAISTAPESTIAAIRAVPNVATIFLGGFDRGYDFTELEEEIRSRGIKNIVLFPESGKRMFADRSGLNVLETSDMKEAVAFAYAHTPKGAACLLSCASPSYGLWKSFEEKGDQFTTMVRQMGAEA